MLQLELDAKYMLNRRSPEEIEFYRTKILRISVRDKKRENYFHPISLTGALTILYKTSYKYFKQVRDDDGGDLDDWVNKTLSKSLPFLQGIEGDFRSFTDFRRACFERKILYRLAIDRHRLIMRQEGKLQLADSFPSKEVRKSRLEGFQPPLLKQVRIRHPLVDLSTNEQFMAGLKDSARVLRGNMFSSWEPNYFSRLGQHKQRALNLWLQDPSLTSVQIANALNEESLGVFPAATIRVWVKRALDKGAVLSLK